MSDKLQPGPYVEADDGHVVVIHGPDRDGHYAYLDEAHGDIWYACPNDLTPVDSWPEWWPFPDAAIPEWPIQVGDFVSYGYMDWLVIGNHFGTFQIMASDGESLRVGVDEVQRSTRPEHWPDE